MPVSINPSEPLGFHLQAENEEAKAVRWLFRNPDLEDEEFLLNLLEQHSAGSKAHAVLRRLCVGWEDWEGAPEPVLTKKGKLSDESLQVIPPAWRIGVSDLAYHLLRRDEEDVEK